MRRATNEDNAVLHEEVVVICRVRVLLLVDNFAQQLTAIILIDRRSEIGDAVINPINVFIIEAIDRKAFDVDEVKTIRSSAATMASFSENRFSGKSDALSVPGAASAFCKALSSSAMLLSSRYTRQRLSLASSLPCQASAPSITRMSFVPTNLPGCINSTIVPATRGQQGDRHKKQADPKSPPQFVKVTAFISELRQVETVQVHDLVPGRHEVSNELLLRVAGPVDFGQSLELRVGTEAQIDTGTGPHGLAGLAGAPFKQVAIEERVSRPSPYRAD